MKLRIFWAARTYEMSVDIQLRTWQYIPEDSELQPFNAFSTLLNTVLEQLLSTVKQKLYLEKTPRILNLFQVLRNGLPCIFVPQDNNTEIEKKELDFGFSLI
jgi:hypothetical protein